MDDLDAQMMDLSSPSTTDSGSQASSGYSSRLPHPTSCLPPRSRKRSLSGHHDESSSTQTIRKKRRVAKKLSDQKEHWCHQCKQKHSGVRPSPVSPKRLRSQFLCLFKVRFSHPQVVICGSKSCSKKYCKRCLSRHYEVDVRLTEPNTLS